MEKVLPQRPAPLPAHSFVGNGVDRKMRGLQLYWRRICHLLLVIQPPSIWQTMNEGAHTRAVFSNKMFCLLAKNQTCQTLIQFISVWVASMTQQQISPHTNRLTASIGFNFSLKYLNPLLPAIQALQSVAHYARMREKGTEAWPPIPPNGNPVKNHTRAI